MNTGYFRCFLILLMLTAPRMCAQNPPAFSAVSQEDRFLGLEIIPLWDHLTARPQEIAPEDTPTLTLFHPQPRAANGTAVIVAPGGAYRGLSANLEGRQVADWLAARGITAFLLKYRLGVKYLYPAPLDDAQRAIRLVRARAKEFGILPNRIGMMGFSAGGHLSAAAGTLFDNGKQKSDDPVDRLSSRPDFMILGYPWLNAMQPNQQGLITYCSVLQTVPADECQSFTQKYTPTFHVTAQTPPAFIFHTTNDPVVPVNASIAFCQALQSAGVSVEMHIFANGAHGTGLGSGDAALDLWPVLLESWLRGRGLLSKAPEISARK